MIKLNSDTFKRAIEKAQKLAPACDLKFTDEINYTFQVWPADGTRGPYTVDIWVQGGTLWTSCDCAAGVGLHRRGFPQPCYHVATAALSVGLFAGALPLGAALDTAPECKAARAQVPAPLIDISELAPIPAPINAQVPAPQFTVGIAALHKLARGLRRALWITRKEAKA